MEILPIKIKICILDPRGEFMRLERRDHHYGNMIRAEEVPFFDDVVELDYGASLVLAHAGASQLRLTWPQAKERMKLGAVVKRDARPEYCVALEIPTNSYVVKTPRLMRSTNPMDPRRWSDHVAPAEDTEAGDWQVIGYHDGGVFTPLMEAKGEVA